MLPMIGGARLAIAPVFLYRPGAEQGRPLYAQPREGAHTLFGGPIYLLQAGRYRASYRIRNGPTRTNAPLASLRVVVYNNLGTTIFPHDITSVANDGDRYHEEEVAFKVPVTSDVETQAYYTGAAPLWIDGVRIWPDPRGPTRVPVTGILTALTGGLLFMFALARRRRKTGYLPAFVLAKICFVISAAVLTIAAEHSGFLTPLNGTWLLPPSLWVAALLAGAGLILLVVQRLTGAREPLIGVADILSDGIVIAILIWTMPRFSFFSLAAAAVAAWICKLALMLFTLALGRRDRALLAAMTVAVYGFAGLLPWYHHYSTSGDETSYLAETLSLLHHKKINTWQVLESGEYRDFAPSADKRSLEADTIAVNGIRGFPARDFGVSIFCDAGLPAR